MKKVKIGSFLNERNDRFTPSIANNLNLKRIEKIDFNGNIHTSDCKPTKTNMILIKNGDLVISGINVQKGAMSVYKGNDDILATIHYSSYIYDKEIINLDYLNWFLKSKTFIKILQEQTGSGIKTELKAKKFLNLEIYLPNIDIQKEIVKTCEKYKYFFDILVNEFSIQKDTIKKLKAQILQDAIMGKLSCQNYNENAKELLSEIKKEKAQLIKDKKIKKEPQLPPIKDSEIPFDIPSNWAWCRLGEICKQVTDGTHHTPTYTNDGIPFISVKDVSSGIIDFANTKFISIEEHIQLTKRCNPEKNDLLLTKVGTTGICILVDTDKKFSIFVSVALLKIFYHLILPNFLVYLINSPLVKKQSDDNTQGIGNKNLVLKLIKNFLIPLPPLSEQKEIVQKIDKIFEKLDNLQKECEANILHSTNLLQSTLKEAFGE